MSSYKRSGKRVPIWVFIPVLIITFGLVFAAISSFDVTGSTPPATATFQIDDTRDKIAADLTQLPQAATLSGELAEKIDALEALIKDCPDYTSERRTQIAQHIAWLREPSTLPQQMIIALEGNHTLGLLRGLATYTLSDWALKERSEDSCLMPIGQQINTLLVAEGGEAIPTFEGVAE